MSAGALVSLDQYLRTSCRPDCDFIDGEVVERNAGKRRHGYAQARIAGWFIQNQPTLNLEALTELRVQVARNRVRIPDVVVSERPLPEEEVFTSPPFLCIEIMSPDDTISGMQDRLDDYLNFGVPNIWVIDPWLNRAGKHRGWRVTADGWAASPDAIMRTAEGRVAMPLADVLLP